MLFEIMISLLDPSQVFTSVMLAVISIIIRQCLPIILAFLRNLLVLVVLFAIFVLSLSILGMMPPHP